MENIQKVECSLAPGSLHRLVRRWRCCSIAKEELPDFCSNLFGRVAEKHVVLRII